MIPDKPKDVTLTAKLRMTSGFKFTAMCPACYSLFNITIPKAKIDFEYTAQDTTDTLSIYNSSLVDPTAYCDMLQLKHNCMRAYLQLSQDGCGPFLVQIDDRIAEAVSLFNKCGFYTSYCCQGHVYRDGSYSRPYIMFQIKKGDKDSEKYLNMLRDAIVRYNVLDFPENSYNEGLSRGWINECADFDPCVNGENLVLSIYYRTEDHDEYTDMEFEDFCYRAADIAGFVARLKEEEEKKEGV